MRLDIFLRRRTGAEPFAARRLLSWLGPSWLRSPVRRVVQALSLALFLVLFFYVLRPYGSPRYAEAREASEIVDAESFLRLDPLVSVVASIAGRAWIPSLVWAGVLLAVTLIVPRGFCGYLCPLGTVVDVFDWLVGRRVTRFRLERRGWWVHLKYYVLAGVIAAAILGVTLSGVVAAIPVLTRGMLFIFAPLQTGLVRGWHLVAPVSAGQIVSVLLFLLVLALGFLGPRFWCRHVCPTGAVFSLVNLLRLTERKVTADCTACRECVGSCPFGAIKSDFTTRGAECTFCQTCGGVCPAGAIAFAPRWSRIEKEPAASVSAGPAKAGDGTLSRRGFVGGLAGGVAGGLVAATAVRFVRRTHAEAPLVRPPGSCPEDEFLARCVRCGECVKACPVGLLRPASFGGGIERLWTPFADCDRAGCHHNCNNCGQVCPTGAVRALALEEKRAARMGLAYVNRATCLPHSGRAECRLCAEQCDATGYHAIEFRLARAGLDEGGAPPEGTTRLLAPVVIETRCVGCGMCQSRCHGVNVREKKLFAAPAIVVRAGPGREDRIGAGSYVRMREERLRRRRLREGPRGKTPSPARPGETRDEESPGDVEYLPEFLR